MKWIVGLGNPGRQYENTRHNFGFLVIEQLRRELKAVSAGSDVLFRRFEARARGLGLLMPQVYMNRSGLAVAAIQQREGLALEDLLVVTDDLNLPLGKLRLRGAGGAGGHNGLKSIIESIGSQEFARLRLGTGRPDSAGEFADFVLDEFEEDEEPLVAEVVEMACEASLVWAREGLAAAMNRFNN